MTTETVEAPTSIVEAARKTVETKRVGIHCKAGVLPLEWPPGNVSDGDYSTHGKLVNVKHVRPITAGKYGIEWLNTGRPEDAKFLAEVRDFIANSNDPRIDEFDVRIVEDANVEPIPFARFDTMKPSVVVAILAEMMGDSAAENAEILASAARFELQLDEPRAEVLDGIEELGGMLGDESDDGSVEEVD